MGCYVEGRAERGGSPVVVVNVLLLAVLMAGVALGASTGTASAHDSGASAQSVNNLQLRVASQSIEYTDARDAGINQWQRVSPINVFLSTNPTVYFYQDNANPGNDYVGLYSWFSNSIDAIAFYKYNIVRFNFGFYDKRWISVHELGHAQRLDHSNSTQNCFTSVMCSTRHPGSGEPWTPQSHDINDVNAYW